MKISLIKTIYAYITIRHPPTLLLDYEWKVHDDLCGRDHFPIFLNNIAPQLEEPITRWKLTKADWPSFKALCETEINDTILQADDPIDRFTTTLDQLAVKTIPRTSIKSKKKKKPWFNDDRKTSIQKRKQALRQFNPRPYTKIWKTFVFFVRKPAARFENQNVNPGNNMFPD